MVVPATGLKGRSSKETGSEATLTRGMAVHQVKAVEVVARGQTGEIF